MKIIKNIEKLAEMGLNILYPRRCPICQEILKNQKALICKTCAESLRPVMEPRCKKCGRPVKESAEQCRDCEEETRAFTEGRGIFLYSDQFRKSVIAYKYDGRREYARFYSAAMCYYGQAEIKRWQPDLILPIPLHKKKKRQRGFNQAEILAMGIGKQFQIPVSDTVLLKNKQTASQKTLDAAARRKNLKNAFYVKEDVKGRKILLIDDVFTTGSTMDAAASVLFDAGAEKVFFLTLCIACAE